MDIVRSIRVSVKLGDTLLGVQIWRGKSNAILCFFGGHTDL